MASVWPQPAFSLLKAHRSPLPVATKRRSMKRWQNSDHTLVATVQTSLLRKTASGSSQPWPKISGNSTLCLPTPAFPAGRRPARPTRPFSRRWSTPTLTALSLPWIQRCLCWTTTAASSLMDRCTIIWANRVWPHTQPQRVVSCRWRERSPQTWHRATSVWMWLHRARLRLLFGSADPARLCPQTSPAKKRSSSRL